MEHVVFFSASDGSPAYRRTANLDDAVRVVEHLRNIEGVEDVHVYALESVALSFRPYYRVEVTPAALQGQPPMSTPAAPVEAAAPVVVPVAVPAQAEPVYAAPAAPAPVEPEPVFAPVAVESLHVAEAPQEHAPALSVVSAPEHDGDEVSTNGRGGRGLGFFTR